MNNWLSLAEKEFVSLRREIADLTSKCASAEAERSMYKNNLDRLQQQQQQQQQRFHDLEAEFVQCQRKLESESNNAYLYRTKYNEAGKRIVHSF
jgi:chromosome segregation ATPase